MNEVCVRKPSCSLHTKTGYMQILYHASLYKGIEYLQIWMPAGGPGTSPLRIPRDDCTVSLKSGHTLTGASTLTETRIFEINSLLENSGFVDCIDTMKGYRFRSISRIGRYETSDMGVKT